MPPFKITLNPFNNQSSNWAPFHKKPGWEESVTWKTSCDKMIGTRRYHRTEKELVVNWLTVVQLLSHVQPLWPHRLKPARLLCPWDFSGKNNGVGCHFILQGIFLTQGLNSHPLRVLHWQVGSLPVSQPGTIYMYTCVCMLSCLSRVQLCVTHGL